MNVVSGTVLAVSNQHARIAVATDSGCSRCRAGKGCGAALVAGKRRREVSVAIGARADIQPGQNVDVVLDDASLLQASIAGYGLPLAGLVAGSGLAYVAGAGELWAACIALAGLCAGWWLGRRRLARRCVLSGDSLRISGLTGS